MRALPLAAASWALVSVLGSRAAASPRDRDESDRPVREDSPRPEVIPEVIPSPPPSFRGAPSIHVHVDAPAGTVIESSPPYEGTWAPVCVAPCDTELPWGRDYRVTGSGVMPSLPFALEGQPGQREDVAVRLSPTVAYAGSVTLIVLGALGQGAGIVLLLGSVIVNATACGDTGPGVPCQDVARNAQIGGAISLAAGTAALIAGLLLVRSSRSTQTQLLMPALMPEAAPKPESAWRRMPEWREPVEAAGPAAIATIATTTIPVLSRSF